MKPHVTLVNPAAPVGAAMHLPFALLGLGYLAAVLEKNQYQVDVIDCQLLKLSLEDFRSEISKRQPNIVGVTSSTLTYQSALNLVKIAKEVCPNCITVVGGSHVTFWDDKALEECPELDIVVRKEGENTLLEVVQRIENGKSYQDVIGTTCRKDGKIVRNPDRPYIEDLDSLPFPARHLWPMERFREYEDILYLATSRGCVYWCEFCSTVRMHGRKYRMRYPKNVADELELLHKTYGISKFTFCDDAFTVDQPRTEALCNEILKRGLKIEWNCGTRVDMITKELLAKMKESGCISVWFGVESGSQKILQRIGRNTTLEQIETAFKLCQKNGIQTACSFMLGMPDETLKDMETSLKFAKKLNPDWCLFNIFIANPDSKLYQEVLESKNYDRLDDFLLSVKTEEFDYNSLMEIQRRFFKEFHRSPKQILKRVRREGVVNFAKRRLNPSAQKNAGIA